MTSYQYLFTSVVGSHMWKMNRPDSDIDLNMVYAVVPEDILAGDNVQRSFQFTVVINERTFDVHTYEIGHLIHLLAKGNVNAIWAACSPLKDARDAGVSMPREIIDNHFDGVSGLGGRIQTRLDELVRANLSRESYHSIRGMAHSQLLDAEKHPERALKTLKSCVRTCNFGIKLLTEGELVFDPVKETKQMGSNFHRLFPSRSIQMLDEAYKNSPLPDRPDEKRFRSFLLDVRINPAAFLYNNQGDHVDDGYYAAMLKGINGELR